MSFVYVTEFNDFLYVAKCDVLMSNFENSQLSTLDQEESCDVNENNQADGAPESFVARDSTENAGKMNKTDGNASNKNQSLKNIDSHIEDSDSVERQSLISIVRNVFL